MAQKKVKAKVRIYHTFEVAVDEEALLDGNEDLLDDILIDAFLDSDWYFSDLDIQEVG